ncbi:EutN/CcmL family microcompartment protein [Rhodococcus rhodochrous]|nr:EutN/CcmL family microcompartment protein [Rhodococcus rhodochrous]
MATAKVAALSGTTILMVEDFENGSDGMRFAYAAVDLVGAGHDEVVLVTSGSAARVDEATAAAPVDHAIIAIADTVVTHGEVTYSK